MSSQAATSLSFILADRLEPRQLKRPPYARNGQPIRPQEQGTRFGRSVVNASTRAAKGCSCRSLVGRGLAHFRQSQGLSDFLYSWRAYIWQGLEDRNERKATEFNMGVRKRRITFRLAELGGRVAGFDPGDGLTEADPIVLDACSKPAFTVTERGRLHL